MLGMPNKPPDDMPPPVFRFIAACAACSDICCSICNAAIETCLSSATFSLVVLPDSTSTSSTCMGGTPS